jgi:phosphoglycerol transferase
MVSTRLPGPETAPTVEYVIRIGSRATTTLARTLGSLAAQSYPSLALTLVQFHPVAGLDELLEKVADRFAWINRVVVPNTGNRATSWWAGLNACRAEFIAVLDDDDTLLPNHVESIMRVFDAEPETGFVYTGLIRIQDEQGHYFRPPNFLGPLDREIPERRELFACAEEDFRDFSPLRNIIGHNAWICRRACITPDMLRDPRIEYAEDVFFMILMAGRTRFGFTGMATAEWRWRSNSKDNWSLSYPAHQIEQFLARWHERTQAVRLPVRNRIAVHAGVYDANLWAARDST